jgi:hypothetical protein
VCSAAGFLHTFCSWLDGNVGHRITMIPAFSSTLLSRSVWSHAVAPVCLQNCVSVSLDPGRDDLASAFAGLGPLPAFLCLVLM